MLSFFENIIEYHYHDFGDYDFNENMEKLEETFIPEERDVDSTERSVILWFKNYDIYVKVEGFYSSWDDSSWDKCYLVSPATTETTRFKKL